MCLDKTLSLYIRSGEMSLFDKFIDSLIH